MTCQALTDLGHISSVTYVCHPLWFVCGHRKGILTSPLNTVIVYQSGPLSNFAVNLFSECPSVPKQSLRIDTSGGGMIFGALFH